MKIKILFLVIFSILACSRISDRLDGFIYLRLNTNPTTLDPALVTDVMGGTIGAKLFNGLVRFGQDLSIKPDIAQSWTISKDNRTYTFKLRRDVAFSNGRRVTADDFKYSFERVLNPKTRSPNTWVLSKIVGAKEFTEGKRAAIKGIQVLDDLTIGITIDNPFAPFLGLLAMTAAYVVPKEEVEKWGDDFGNHVAGTGPFILEEWKHGRALKLRANKNYFEGKPKINGIIYGVIPENLTAVAEFEAGNLDAIGIPQSEFSHYTKNKEWKDKIASNTGLNTYYLGMNCDKPPLNNHLVRQALSYAIDRDKILRTIYEGRGILADGPVPPQIIPSHYLEKRQRKGYTYDPQKARDLLKKAGYPNGLSIKIYLTSEEETLDIVETIKHYLDKVGIHADLTQLEWSAYKEAINRGEPDAFWISWWADYPDPENFLFPLFHSSNWGAGGNRTRFKDHEVDSLIEEAQKEINTEKRYKLYDKVESKIVELSPWVFFWHRTDYAVFQRWVKGYRVYPIYSIDKGMEVEINRGLY